MWLKSREDKNLNLIEISSFSDPHRTNNSLVCLRYLISHATKHNFANHFGLSLSIIFTH